MAVAQLVLLLATVAVLDLALGQAYNGYINPLFLPRDQRRGRLYDPNISDLRDNAYLLSRRDDYRRLPVDQDYNRYDDYRRSQNPNDIDRRYQNPYDIDFRYQNPSDVYRRYSNFYDDNRRYSVGLDRRIDDLYLEDNRVRYPSSVGLGTTTAPFDKGQLLGRGFGLRERFLGINQGAPLGGRDLGLEPGLSLGLDRGQGLGLDRGQGLGLDRGQGLGLDRGQGLGLDREQGLGLDRGQGLGLDRGQGIGLDRGFGMNRGLVRLGSEQGLEGRQTLSTSSPELSVSIDPNSST